MMRKTLMRLGLVAGAAAALSACGGYGYGTSVGYASDYPAYGGPVGYAGDYYGGFGYPGYGYYNDFYYPGTGIYVFDRSGHRRAWNDAERAHWQNRGEFRGGHLMQNGRFDQRRDRGYMNDRRASYRDFQRQSRGGGGPRGGPQGGGPQGGHESGHQHPG
ncbi:MAG: hypothetical protein ACRYG4_09325 [Janthinobacterium lividum]